MRKLGAVGQQNDADLALGYESDIGRRVVEAAWLVDDVHSVHRDILPCHRLPEFLVDPEHFMPGHLQRLAQLRLSRSAAEAGAEKNGEVPRRGEYLPGPGEIIIALLVARRTDRH